MKNYYVIYFEGLFEKGYCTNTKEDIIFETLEESLSIATRFRFKFFAKLICYLLNKTNKDLRVFSVKVFKYPVK